MDEFVRELSKKFENDHAYFHLDSICFIASSQDAGFGFEEDRVRAQVQNIASTALGYSGEDQFKALRIMELAYGRAYSESQSALHRLHVWKEKIRLHEEGVAERNSMLALDADPTAKVRRRAEGRGLTLSILKQIAEDELVDVRDRGVPRDDEGRSAAQRYKLGHTRS